MPQSNATTTSPYTTEESRRGGVASGKRRRHVAAVRALKVRHYRRQGWPAKRIAERLGVCLSTVYNDFQRVAAPECEWMPPDARRIPNSPDLGIPSNDSEIPSNDSNVASFNGREGYRTVKGLTNRSMESRIKAPKWPA